jgi:DNA adenine methylase
VKAAKPVLKWAGGKRQLLPQLRQYYPARFESYLEPFLGSGAVFFDLQARGALRGHRALLADSSLDLIGTYLAVRDHVDEVIRALGALQAGHADGAGRHYYEVRDERFNPQRRAVHAAGGTYPAALAAMFIYLNRTGYNGLFRVNARGDFNVPAGRYDRPRVCDADNLRAASAALQPPGVELVRASFLDALGRARAGDFVYLDPPYAPLNRTANFTEYTAEGFGPAEQRALREAVLDLAGRGVQVLLSNSAADEVKRLYGDNRLARRLGLRTHLVPARRAINSRGTSRGPVLEYVITNVGC